MRPSQITLTKFKTILEVKIYIYFFPKRVIEDDTKKKGTFEMRSGSHVNLAALRNRDLELQTTSPF